jgi:hypothetical protein
MQQRYENGRLIASNTLAAGAKIRFAEDMPSVIDANTGALVPYSAQAYWSANRKVGHWRPSRECVAGAYDDCMLPPPEDTAEPVRALFSRSGFPRPVPTVSSR